MSPAPSSSACSAVEHEAEGFDAAGAAVVLVVQQVGTAQESAAVVVIVAVVKLVIKAEDEVEMVRARTSVTKLACLS